MLNLSPTGNFWHFRVPTVSQRYVTQNCKGKGKAIPLQALTGPEGSREVEAPRFYTSCNLERRHTLCACVRGFTAILCSVDWAYRTNRIVIAHLYLWVGTKGEIHCWNLYLWAGTFNSIYFCAVPIDLSKEVVECVCVFYVVLNVDTGALKWCKN
jgi:hypothetical protein